MASFKSILADIGHGFEKVFKIGVEVAVVAEPIIDVAFPGIGALFTETVSAVASAETAAVAAGAQSGTGPQKLSLVVASITKSFTDYATANKTPVNQTNITAWANAVVAALNAIPAATSG